MEGAERFFYQPEETSFYVQSLGKLLVSVFTQQLWCQYYKSVRQPNIKKPKDKDKKKIFNFWTNLSTAEKLSILEINKPEYFLERLIYFAQDTNNQRVSKQVIQKKITLNQIEMLLKEISCFSHVDFYDKLKTCTLMTSYQPQLNRMVCSLQDQRPNESIESSQCFQKEIKTKKKEGILQIKIVSNKIQVNQVRQKSQMSSKEQELGSLIRSPVKIYQEDKSVEMVTPHKPKPKNNKNNKNFNKPKRMNLRKKCDLLLKDQNSESEQKSKQQTSTSSPRASEISSEPKMAISQSDIEILEILQYQPSCCQFNRKDKSDECRMQDILDCQEKAQETFEPSQEDFYRRQKELFILKQKILNDTVEEYATKLREHAFRYQYSRMVAYNRLLHILSPLGVTLNVFGSWATGLILSDSDIDLAVGPFILNYFISCFGTTRDKIVSALYSIKSIIECRSWIKLQKLLDQAQVPVLKFSIDTNLPFEESDQSFYNVPNGSIKTVISIDLTIQEFQSSQKTHVGLLVSSLMNQWKQRYPCVLPICLTLKQLLRRKKMGDAYTGGLSPYCLMIMLVAFLKQRNLVKSTNSGAVLIQFLLFYTTQFNYRCMGIDVIAEEDTSFFSREQSQGVMIVEPVTKRIIKSTYSMLPQILQYFKELHEILIESTLYIQDYKNPCTKIPSNSVFKNVLLDHCSIQ